MHQTVVCPAGLYNLTGKRLQVWVAHVSRHFQTLLCVPRWGLCPLIPAVNNDSRAPIGTFSGGLSEVFCQGTHPSKVNNIRNQIGPQKCDPPSQAINSTQ